MKFSLVILMIAAAACPLAGSVELLVGVEGPAREPEFNKTQEWFGLEYTSQMAVWRDIHFFGKALIGSNSSGEFLLNAGLAWLWTPWEAHPEFRMRLQTGPSYTEVGWPHTGTEFNWTTDLAFSYHGFFAGYSHTSNAGLGKPNSGLDMILLGYSFSWE